MEVIMESQILILSVGLDSMLLESRNRILRAAGYIVEPAHSVKDAIHQIQKVDFDLVLLCHSIPPQDRDRLTCLIRASGLHTPVASVGARSGQNAGGFTEVTIEPAPAELLHGIQNVLLKAGKRYRLQGHMSDSPATFEPQCTILSIDDDPTFLLFRRKLLERAGYTVLTTQVGSAGLKIFPTGIVDAVILDYVMPTMNGVAIAAQMREINREVPLILCSGLSSIRPHDLALFDRVVPKGLSPSLLLAALQQVCPTSPQTAFAPALSRAAS
jgi:CheY-like chemotaxis protein